MNNYELSYLEPATRWFEALPLGNGKLGAMVYGSAKNDRIDLTEATCYSGCVGINNKKNAPEYIEPIRKALLNKDYIKATEISEQITGIKGNYGTNLTMGSLYIKMLSSLEKEESYVRKLDLSNAISSFDFKTKSKNSLKREYYISNKDNVLVIKTDSTLKSNWDISLEDIISPSILISDSNSFTIEGKAYESKHSDGETGVTYYISINVIPSNGDVMVDCNHIKINNCSSFIIYVSAKTTFNPNNPALPLNSIECIETCKNDCINASNKNENDIRKSHVSDYQKLFNKMSIELKNNKITYMDTKKRLEAFKSGKYDEGLIFLMCQYARYLIISSSRENSSLPSHLQGIWNDNTVCKIGWTVDMHLDINTQMNYFPVNIANLSNCAIPLFNWLKDIIVPSGKITANKTYGLNGFVAHTVSNPWGYTSPGWAPYWGFHPTAGAWISLHAFEYFQYTNDLKFLEETAYPIIKESVLFFLDYLFYDESSGYLMTGPSHSPENTFIHNGIKSTICLSPTCDIAILNSLFDSFIESASILEKDSDLAAKAKKSKKLLPPYQIDKEGKLQEWFLPHKEALPNHRHTTNLLGVLFSQITKTSTPDLAKAAETSIKKRLTPKSNWEDTGWARSLLIIYQSLLHNMKESHQHIVEMVQSLTEDNLFVIHPPTAGATKNVYEIDGNTGMLYGVLSTFIQSHKNILYILPGDEKIWSSLSIKGLKSKGNVTVDLEIENGKLACATFTSNIKKEILINTDAVPMEYSSIKKHKEFKNTYCVSLNEKDPTPIYFN